MTNRYQGAFGYPLEHTKGKGRPRRWLLGYSSSSADRHFGFSRLGLTDNRSLERWNISSNPTILAQHE